MKYVPFLMSVGIGLSINNTRAVFEALFNKQSEFTRTPKYRIEARRRRVGRQEVPPVGRRAAAHRAGARPLLHRDGLLRARQRIYGTLPFLVLFQVGFLYTGLLSIVQQYAGDSTSSRLEASSQSRQRFKVKVQGRGPPRHARHHPLRHRSPRRARRRLRRARAGKTTILKDNISWHFPFPGGEHDAVAARRDDPGARAARLHRSGLRPEQDGRHQRVQGRGPEPLRPDLQALRHPRPLQLQGRGHDVGATTGRRRGCACSIDIFPEGIQHPRLLLRQEHRPPADDEVPHLHDDDRRDEERVRRPAEHAAALHALVDSRDARRSARDPEGDPLRASSRSWTARRPATARARARCIRS